MHRERERERFPLLCGCTCNQWMTHKLDAVGTREKLNLRIYTVDLWPLEIRVISYSQELATPKAMG